MRIHCLQHVPFEGLGSMAGVFKERGDVLTATRFYENGHLPHPSSFDLLVVIGDPMGVYDTIQYPWLKGEMAFIRKAVEAKKKMLGICLGAQLITCALGSGVTRNLHREIGWFPLSVTPKTGQTLLGDIFYEGMEVFHWHGDRFEIPENAVRIALSRACDNQGFILEDRVIGF